MTNQEVTENENEVIAFSLKISNKENKVIKQGFLTSRRTFSVMILESRNFIFICKVS